MNKYNPEIHDRHSIRLKGYDYSQAGLYFITICTKNREHLFGEIKNGEMILNEYGEIVCNCWFDISNHYKNIELDNFVVMPNHFHGIVNMVGAGFKPAPTGNTTDTMINDNEKYHGLSEIIRALKTFSARKINEIRETKGVSVWQRNYYEHIIRDETAYFKISKYIINNPQNWKTDENYKADNQKQIISLVF